MRAGGEVEGPDVVAPVVEERGHRGAVALSRLPVAVEAGLRVPDLQTFLARGGVVRRLLHVLDGIARAFFLPARGEGLDVLDDVAERAVAQHRPGRHVRVIEALVQRAHEVLVHRQRTAGRRAALEDGAGEVARMWVEPLRGVAVPVAVLSVTGDTEALVDRLAP